MKRDPARVIAETMWFRFGLRVNGPAKTFADLPPLTRAARLIDARAVLDGLYAAGYGVIEVGPMPAGVPVCGIEAAPKLRVLNP